MSFDVASYLSQFDADLLAIPEGRRILTRTNPLLFALLYRENALRLKRAPDPYDPRGRITFADFHLQLAEMGRDWIRYNAAPKPNGYRKAIIAPRNMGKSTWLYNILMLWGAAHGHVRVVAAFADNADMAHKHFSNFRTQIDSNDLLKQDFPELCNSGKRKSGGSIADNSKLYVAESGFAIASFGIDSVSVGMNVNDERPDLILLDDIEGAEGQYTPYQAEQRLRVMRTAVLPMEDSAKTILVGTTLMFGSLIHQLVRAAKGGEVAEWIREEGFQSLYFPPIVTKPDGTEESCWPEKWSMEWHNERRSTRQWKMVFENNPMSGDSAYWESKNIHYGTIDTCTRWVISIDPHVSESEKSDYTGIAVMAYSPVERRIVVHHIEQVKLTNEKLRQHIEILCARFPQVQKVLVETNQGGILWKQVLSPLPPNVGLDFRVVKGKKEVRAANALVHYQQPIPRVIHAGKFHLAEDQMFAFPNVKNDDMVDALVNGILYLFETQTQQRPRKPGYRSI